MRLSNFYLYTIKEEPNDAFLSSHKLMLRSGMIRQVASGIYSWLPYGLLVLKKIKNLITDMHVKNNIHEILMPTIQPADIWIKSGRFEDYGKEMLKIKDRNKIDLLYGPTNEEMITDIISKDLKSYKDLPKILFHTQWKFRDELRPRFGIMRCREFLMKDAYSFDDSYDNAYFSYCKMFVLYMKIFKALGLKVLPVKADSGPIGGGLSHEFVIESKEGESEIYFDKRLNNILFDSIDINNKKDVIDTFKNTSSLYSCTNDMHNVSDFSKIDDDNRIVSKGIEVGHIFYFGTKYSEKLKATFTNKSGSQEFIFSGSYGIGVSRLVGAIIEANHDEKGILLPKEISPFQLGLINVRNDSDISSNFCENFYKEFSKKYNILYDDRETRVGDKFNNMDLIGLPLQLIIGEKNLLNNKIEIKDRISGNIILVEKDNLHKILIENYGL